MTDHAHQALRPRIEIAGAKAAVSGIDVPDIQNQLGYEVHHFSAGGKTGCTWERGREALVVPTEHGGIMPAGLVPRVLALLQSQGHQAEVRDHRKDRRPLRVSKRLPEEITADEQLLVGAVIGHRQGQIVIRKGGDRIRVISLICWCFPAAHVLILASTREEVRDLHRKLGQPLRFNLGRQFGSRRISRFPRVVATMASGAIYDTAKWDIILYPFAEQLTQKQAFEAAMRCGGPRVYGIVEAGSALPRRTRLIVEGICGPVIHELPDPGGRRADVRVLMFEAPWCPAPGKLTVLERKRRMYWHSDARNGAVAEVATAFDTGNPEPLWQHGLLLSEEDGNRCAGNQRRRVAIVVESPEHGRHLLKHLPDWRLVDANMPAKDRRGKIVLDRAVVTMLAADRQRQLDVDVLVWAAGGRAVADFPGFPPRYPDGRARQVLLIDVADDFDETAVDNTSARIRAYDLRRWQIDDRTAVRGYPDSFSRKRICRGPRGRC